MGLTVVFDIVVDKENTTSIDPTITLKVNVDDETTGVIQNKSKEAKMRIMRGINIINAVEAEIIDMLAFLGVPEFSQGKIINEVLEDLVRNIGQVETQVSFRVTADVGIFFNEDEEENHEYDDESEENSVYDSDDELESNGKNGAPEHLIAGLKKQVYKGEVREDGKEDGKDVESRCPICTDFLVSDESEVITCACNHTFHSECITDWLLINNSCPVCRSPVVNIKSD